MHYNYEYFKRTAKLDMADSYRYFFQYFQGKTILDLGCGSGRDSNYFKQQNYEVSSVDNNEYAKQFSSREYNINVDLIDIEQGVDGVFDGIWCCASLVHMNQDQILQILKQLKNNITDQGVIYVSLKYGEGILVSNNQKYYLYDESLIDKIKTKGYILCDVKITNHDNPMNRWIEFVIKKI